MPAETDNEMQYFMAYETYTTEALVCGTRDRNTADRSFLLFTREAGMLFADARSVREERSRQRYALQDFTYLRVSLVKGKAGWRIGSIEPLRNFYHEADSKEARGSVVSLVRLLRRFVHGEEAQPQFFDEVITSLESLLGKLSKRTFVEQVVQVRLLGQLGYVDMTYIPESLRAASVIEIPDLYAKSFETGIAKLYAHAVKASHL